MAKIETLRKITLGTCEVQPDSETVAALEKKGPMPLLDVYGVATKYKAGESNFGPFVAFLGSFRAVRHGDKAVFQSGKLILPKMLEEQLYAIMGGGDDVNNVQFAFRIGAKFDKKAATKYTYTAESLTPPAENDPVTMLEKQLSGKLLAAPKA